MSSPHGSPFDMGRFLAGLGDQVRPGTSRPLVVRAEDVRELSASDVHNPSSLSVVGDLPTVTFEIFRQEIPAGASSDMQRHHHETVHVVLAGEGHSEVEGHGDVPDETASWSTGSFVYTPPWTWHRHYNDSATAPVQFLTIENSRLLGLLGVNRRQSAGMVDMATARALFDTSDETTRRPDGGDA